MSLVQPLQHPASSAEGASAIGRAIRARRRMLGVSQAELGSRIGRSRKWVSELEGGSTSPGIDSVASAAACLGMDLTLEHLGSVRVRGASLPGSFERPNEDAWGSEGPLAWVIDGATQPLDTVQTLDARTYAHALGEAIGERAADTRAPLTEILADAIDRASTWPAAEPGPAATVAMARRSGTGFEWLVLGDAALLMRTDASASDARRIALLTDDRLASIAVPEREARRRARESGASPDELAERSADLYRAELAMRNRPGGYWVASGDPEAAAHALHGYTDTLGPVLLASDGMLDVLGTAAPWRTRRTAFASWVEAPPEESVARVRDARSAIPGAKVDDATLVVVR